MEFPHTDKTDKTRTLYTLRGPWAHTKSHISAVAVVLVLYSTSLTLNSLDPGRCVRNPELIFSKLISRMSIFSEDALSWMPQDLTDD